jgi:lipopolysaccharide biosynthesis regulator YciM
MEIELWWLLVIPFMFVVGWVSANWDRKQQKDYKEQVSNDFEQIILFLSEGKLLKASNSLLNAAKKDPNSYALQLSLGILYRKSGMIDRAIEVHGSLLLVKDLSNKYRDWIVFELAKDYLEAGLYDRADLSLKLLEKTSFYEESLELRLSLAQRLKNWSDAIVFAEKLEVENKNSLKHLKIHFFCEMAEKGDDTAKDKAQKLAYDHPRVQALDKSPNHLNYSVFSSKSFVCSVCGANFSNHFWRCHVCNSWDSANSLKKII